MFSIRASIFSICLIILVGSPLQTAGGLAMVCAANGQPTIQSQDEDKSDEPWSVENTKKSRIRFGQWNEGIVWMFSKEKWTPIIESFKKIFRLLIDPAVLEDDGFRSDLPGVNLPSAIDCQGCQLGESNRCVVLLKPS